MADLVIRNGTVVDGNGGAPFVADVAITAGKISALGPGLSIQGAKEIDASGKHVLPGWTDVHSHFDVQCMWDPLLSPSAGNGVTTVVMGNCGVGAAPCRKEDRDFMVHLLEGVEDIPAESIDAGTKWVVDGMEWESYPEYLDALDKLSYAIDLCSLVSHGQVRQWVLGHARCNLADKPGGPLAAPLTQQEKEEMAAVVKEAVQAGAIGFSTNRFGGHRDTSGVLVPGTLADADELIMIGKAVAEAGGGMFEMAQVSAHSRFIQRTKLIPQLWFVYFGRTSQAMTTSLAISARVTEWKSTTNANGPGSNS